jgi:hypothetical protein
MHRLIASLEVLSDPTRATITQVLVRGAWEAFANPNAMAGLEILIATKELRASLDPPHLERLGAALTSLIRRLEADSDDDDAVTLGLLLWTPPDAMMIAEMFATVPLATEDAQKAVAKMIDGDRTPNGPTSAGHESSS